MIRWFYITPVNHLLLPTIKNIQDTTPVPKNTPPAAIKKFTPSVVFPLFILMAATTTNKMVMRIPIPQLDIAKQFTLICGT